MKNQIIVGQKFNKWTVLEKDLAKRKDAHTYWICQCECGNIKSVRSTSLRSNKSTSCGCEKGFLYTSTGSNKQIDITNQKFGLLTAVMPTDKRSGNHVVWHCLCECGNTIDVDGHSLRAGLTHSCGCLHISVGELKIASLLQQNNIPFETEKSFIDCKFPLTNRCARFDFYVNNQYLIEFDGRQHFEVGGTIFSTPEKVKSIQERDAYKNQWCKKQNIPLIRIPYSHLSQLSINDLKLETSNFII